jgi:hypothetical protein
VLRHRLDEHYVVAVFRRDGRLHATGDLAGDPVGETLDEPFLIYSDPPVLVGTLPPGADRVAEAEGWTVQAGDGGWLAVGEESPRADPSRLEYVLTEGGRERVRYFDADEAPPAQSARPPVDDAGRAYAAALAAAIAADLAAHPPKGSLRRFVIRWFWEGDPLYLTLHALGADGEQPASGDAWLPLEWTNADDELERTDRVLADETVRATAEAMGPLEGEAHVPAVLEAVRILPEALAARGVEVTGDFAAKATHFEGWE